MAKRKAPAKKRVRARTTRKAAAPKKSALSKKGKASGKKNRKTPTSKLPKVRVQMFRQGLGDSFLVTLDYQGADERRILIDCGSLGNSAFDTDVKAIAKHLKELVDSGKRIDVLAATHEHQDHVSGFRQKEMQNVLKGNVDRVWMAWTENPQDPDAKRLVKFKKDLGLALSQAARVAPDRAVSGQIESLLGFAGDVLLGADFAKTVDEAMDFVRKETGAPVEYREPGELIEEDWLGGFRIYVLGPPRSDEFLKDMGDRGSEELYHLSLHGVAAALGRTTRFHLDDATSLTHDDGLPFDERFTQVGERPMRERYPAYFAPDDDWRRIDYDWLDGASELALQLDDLTNNTSLALAIERVADGKVLLFPADAQQGHWLSWHDPKMKWKAVKGADGTKRDVDAADLLSRTVFYKVGHHCSHNATARGKGLELMTQEDDLVAFIPVDRAIAVKKGKARSWQMPARALYRELLKRCQGRVVRADQGWAKAAGENDDVEQELFDLEPAKQWTAWAKKQQAAKHVDVTSDLFCSYVLE